MNTKTSLSLGVIVAILLLIYGFVYTVSEKQRGVLLRFGEIVNADIKPGLRFKLPFVHEPKLFDGRAIALDMEPADYLTQEKKRLTVDSFIMWRIADVKKYYTSTGGGLIIRANRLLAPRINEGLRNKFGQRNVREVISGERAQLVEELTEAVNKLTVKEFGVEVMDVRIKRIELPPDARESVYRRMRAERERKAREHRSKGHELAEGIRADADRQQRVIEADAYREAEIVRGEGDARAAALYAKAFSKDPEFYDFYRSLRAYTNTFSDKRDVMVLQPEGEFFKYLNRSSQ